MAVRAVEIARAGLAESPPAPVPAAVRPVLRFRRLPPAAVETVLAALDADDEFRSRVAAQVSEAEFGRVAWLWLRRPEGWRDQIDALVEQLGPGPVRSGSLEPSEVRALRRRLAGAQRAAERARERAEVAEAEARRLRHELDELKRQTDRAARERDELVGEAAARAAERAGAVAELKRTEGLLARRVAEVHDLEQRLAQLEEGGGRAPPEPAPGADGGVVACAEEAGRIVASVSELGGLVARLQVEAARLVEQLDASGRAVATPARREASAPPDASARRRRTPERARRPVPLPPGLPEDTAEAAGYLLSRPAAVLVVDGYNVSMAAWPDAELPEQRDRLVSLMGDVAARNPELQVELVFDGADVSAVGVARRPPGVVVRFSAPDQLADDLVLELVERFPADRPVVVASSDREVGDGARRRGANVLAAPQLLVVARS